MIIRQEELIGKVQTVMGIVEADSLGITLSHEHLLIDMSDHFVEPTEASEKLLAHQPLSLANLCWVKNNWQNHLENMKLMDEQVAIKEAQLYKLAGGRTIVELSNIGLGRNPQGLSRISRATGLNIVMGSGYFTAITHHPDLATRVEEEITAEIVRDIMVGVLDTGVRAGIIGEIGCSTPLQETELKVLRASAAAQQQTGAAINIHPCVTDDLVLEIINILADAGADLSHTIISHIDIFSFSRATLHKLADAGCYLEYDSFGQINLIPSEYGHVLNVPGDMQRINSIVQLIDEGYLNQILVSQDACFKHLLTTYGGCGYSHILRHIIPIMRLKGLSEEQINTLLVENPKRVLRFAQAKN